MSNPSLTLLSLAQQDIPTTDDLLAQALPHIRDALTDILAIGVYRITPAGYVAWQRIGDDSLSDFITHADMPIVKGAIEARTTAQDSTVTIAPLLQDGDLFALLITRHTAPPKLDDIKEITSTLALIIYNKQLQELMQRQLLATRNIADAENLGDVAGFVGMSFLTEGRFITINLFDFDANGEIVGAHSVASANRYQSYEQTDTIDVANDYLTLVYNELVKNSEFLISDVNNDKTLSEADKAYLQSRQIKGIYNLPITNDDKIIGFISIADRGNILALTPLERQSFRAVMTQASATLNRRQMLVKTETGLQDLQQLYSLTRDVTAAETLPDLLQSVYDNLGQTADFASISQMDYDNDGNLTNVYFRYTIINDVVTEVSVPWSKQLTPETLKQVSIYLQEAGDAVEVISNIDDMVAKYSFFDIVYQQGVRSSITIPVFEDGKRHQQITLAWRKAYGFDDTLVQMMESAKVQIGLVLRSRTILEESQRNATQSIEQARLLQRLNDLILTTNREQNEDALLQVTANVLLDVTNANHIGISLIRNEQDEAQVVAEAPETGIVGDFIEGREGGIPQQLREKRAPILVTDVETVEYIDERSRQALKATGAQSAFFVGMFDLEENLLGTVGFDYFEKVNEFDESIINLARTIVAQVAVNLQKLRLLAASQQQAIQMQRITEFSQSMLASLKYDDIVNIGLEAAREVLQADYVSVMMYDREADILRQVGEFWDNDTNINTPGILISKGANNIAYDSWQKRDVVRLDALQSNWDSKHPYLNQLGSLLAAPMVTGGIMFGVMEVGSKRLLDFSETDVSAFRQMSNQLAVAISNAETYEQSQKLARNKVLANDVIASIQQQTDVQDILRVTIQELGTALGAKRARIRLGFDTSNASGSGENGA